jgi:hypothetical protein
LLGTAGSGGYVPLSLQQGQYDAAFAAEPSSSQSNAYAYDRLHVSPVLHRRGLRAAGPGWHVDDNAGVGGVNSVLLGANLTAQSPMARPAMYVPGRSQQRQPPVTTITGILIIHIIEGRSLRAVADVGGGSDQQQQQQQQSVSVDELYCVLEVDGEHRARTGVSTVQQAYRWAETFEIDVVDARQADIYVYSWHPQYRHKLCHRGSLKLLEAFIVDRLSGDRTFALTLEPSGQLLVRIGFVEMHQGFGRSLAPSSATYFGVALANLVHHEQTDVPVLLRRFIDEIERRGVDANGMYLCK